MGVNVIEEDQIGLNGTRKKNRSSPGQQIYGPNSTKDIEEGSCSNSCSAPLV